MNYKRVIAGAAVLAVVACSSGGDSGTTPTNKAPEIAFTFTPLATPQNVPVNLTITATDPDNDPLTINWTITRGATLTPQNSRKTVMRWTPAALGVDTVNVSVTDGTVTKKLTEVIKVGYALTNPPASEAPPVFQKSKSPYIVTLNAADPRLTVLEGNVTTIEPGVEIYVNTADAFFDVLGELDAHGTVDEPIIIRQNNRTFACGTASSGSWAGILASGASSVVDLEYVELWFPQKGVRLRDSSIGILSNVSVRCSGVAGAVIEGFGSLRAIDSKFTDGTGDGVVIATSLPDSVRIQGCTLSFNHSSGIRMDLDDVAQVVPIHVEFNDIEFNDAHGISLANSVFPQIHFNKFLGNGDSSISSLFLQGGYPDPVNLAQLDATCNFWGAASASQAAIDIGIHDSLDASTVHTRVKSCPWLNTDPLTTTPNCSMSCP